MMLTSTCRARVLPSPLCCQRFRQWRNPVGLAGARRRTTIRRGRASRSGFGRRMRRASMCRASLTVGPPQPIRLHEFTNSAWNGNWSVDVAGATNGSQHKYYGMPNFSRRHRLHQRPRWFLRHDHAREKEVDAGHRFPEVTTITFMTQSAFNWTQRYRLSPLSLNKSGDLLKCTGDVCQSEFRQRPAGEIHRRHEPAGLCQEPRCERR